MLFVYSMTVVCFGITVCFVVYCLVILLGGYLVIWCVVFLFGLLSCFVCCFDYVGFS